jgi:hypothetical protein
MKNFKTLLLSLTLVIMAVVLNSCDKETNVDQASVAELDLNYKKWQSLAIKNYQFTEQLNCFCVDRGPYTLTVANSAIATIKDKDGNNASSGQPGVKTIDDLFLYIKASLERNPATVTIKYNATYGYPESIYFDFDKQMADEEMGYTLSEFSNKTL